MIEAMRFAVHQINRDRRFLHGYQLRFNKCYNIPDTNTNTNEIMKNTFVDNIPFLVGPHSSETSYVSSILSGIFGQSVISYGATFVDFPDVAGPKSNMLRTVPSNRFRIKALIDIVKTLHWNYVSVVSSYGYDGERDARYFIQESNNLKICFGSIHNLPRVSKTTDYQNALKDLAKDKRTRVVLLFTNNKDSKDILKAATQLDLADRFQMFCVLGCTNYDEVVKGNEQTAVGTLSLDLHNYPNKDFEEFFKSLKPGTERKNDVYFQNFWEMHFNCSLDKNDITASPLSSSSSSSSFRPTQSPCSGNESLTNIEFIRQIPAHTVINAVYAFACAARDIVLSICGKSHQGGSRKCYLDASQSSTYFGKVIRFLTDATLDDGTIDMHKAFQDVNYTDRASFGDFEDSSRSVRYNLHIFRRDMNGDYSNLLVGNWSTKREGFSAKIFNSNNRFSGKTSGTTNIPVKSNDEILTEQRSIKFEFVNEYLVRNVRGIVCSSPCPVGFYQVPDSNLAKTSCCFTCRQCPDLHVSHNGTCVKCAATEKVVDNKCTMLQQRWISMRKNVPALIFVFLSIAGILSVMFTTFIFYRNNEHKLVRASGRDLFYIMLFGVLLTFVYPYAVFTKPSRVSCVFRGILPGLAFLTCYAPLFLKTNRIYRIFIHGKRSATPPALVSPQSQLLILTGIMAIQFLLSSVFFVTKSLDPDLLVAPDRSHILLKCKGDSSPILMGLNLAMSVVFMFSCTVLAFKTRHFPKNFNEAKDIGVTLYVTCVIWSVFLPAYFLTVPWRVPFIRDFLITGLSTVIGYTSLYGLFGRKLKILLTDKRRILKENSSEIFNGYDCVSSISQRINSISGVQTCTSSNGGVKASFQMIDNDRQDTLSPFSRSNSNVRESDILSSVSEDLL